MSAGFHPLCRGEFPFKRCADILALSSTKWTCHGCRLTWHTSNNAAQHCWSLSGLNTVHSSVVVSLCISSYCAVECAATHTHFTPHHLMQAQPGKTPCREISGTCLSLSSCRVRTQLRCTLMQLSIELSSPSQPTARLATIGSSSRLSSGVHSVTHSPASARHSKTCQYGSKTSLLHNTCGCCWPPRCYVWKTMSFVGQRRPANEWFACSCNSP